MSPNTPATGALVPESDSVLCPILKKLGISVERYRDLGDADSIRNAVEGLSSQELIFLFCNLSVSKLQAAEAAGQLPLFSNSETNSFDQKQALNDPAKQMELALAVKEQLQKETAVAVRKQVELVIQVPKGFVFSKNIPNEAHLLPDGFDENYVIALLQRWMKEGIKDRGEIHEEVQKLTSEALRILIAHEDPLIRQILSQWLLQLLDINPENIQEVGNDQAALENFLDSSSKPIKLLLTGARSPNLDGLELLKILKDERIKDARANIRSILLVENFNNWVDVRNADHFLIYPYTIQQLHGILIHVLRTLNADTSIFKKFDEEPSSLPDEPASPGSGTVFLPSTVESLSRISLPISAAEKVIIEDGSSYHGHLEMSGSAGLLDDGKPIPDYEWPEPTRLRQSITKETEDIISRLQSQGLLSSLQFITKVTAVFKEKQVNIGPAGHERPTTGELKLQLEGERQSAALSKRKNELREEDQRLNFFLLLNHYLSQQKIIDLEKPADKYDPKALGMFHGNSPRRELTPSGDWEISRTLKQCSEKLGLSSIVSLKKIAQEAAQVHATATDNKDYRPIVIDFGPGNGNAMDEFVLAEGRELNQSPAIFVGVGRSLLIRLSDFLDQVMAVSAEGGKSHFSARQIKQFASHINTLLLSHRHSDGRYIIDLIRAEDHDRLRQHMLEVAFEEETKAVASGEQRVLRGSTGRYAKDSTIKLNKDDIRCIREFVKEPEVFLRRYFPDLFEASTPEKRETLFGLRGRDMIFDDFRNLGKIWKDVGQFITFAYSVKSFSHLEDGDYGRAVNEVCRHLVPGGIFVDEGIQESYTWFYRIEDLREVQRNLGDEFSVRLIGDAHRPYSVVIQRGIPNNETPPVYSFSDDKIDGVVRGKFKRVPLEHYETEWPKAAFKNKIISEVKTKSQNFLFRGIFMEDLKMSGAQTWRNAGYHHIDQAIRSKLNKYFKTDECEKLINKIQARSHQKSRNDKAGFSHTVVQDQDSALFWTYWESTGRRNLDQFIQQTLKNYHSK